MGGGDLNMKKSWHVVTWQNREKVWKREQEVKAEEKKLQELQKQIREERQIEDLKRVQMEAMGNSYQQRLDWMYEGAMQSSNAEEFLLGKPVKDENTTEELKKLTEGPGAIQGLSFDKANLPNGRDHLMKMKEDPLMMIKRRELEARKNAMKNPLNKQRLLAQLEQQRRHKQQKKLRNQETRHKKRKRHSPTPTTTTTTTTRRTTSDSNSHSPPRRGYQQHGQQQQQRQQRRDRGRLTAEEKKKRLAEMEKDANRRLSQRDKRLARYNSNNPNNNNNNNNNNPLPQQRDHAKRPKFLDSVHNSTYLESGEKVEDRLKRNAYTRQSNTDHKFYRK